MTLCTLPSGKKQSQLELNEKLNERSRKKCKDSKIQANFENSGRNPIPVTGLYMLTKKGFEFEAFAQLSVTSVTENEGHSSIPYSLPGTRI